MIENGVNFLRAEMVLTGHCHRKILGSDTSSGPTLARIRDAGTAQWQACFGCAGRTQSLGRY